MTSSSPRGATIRAAGSGAAFRCVDLDAVQGVARAMLRAALEGGPGVTILGSREMQSRVMSE